MAPRYTIIIPVAHFAEAEPALARLREIAPVSGMQILVALGQHPARQRNAALSRSTAASSSSWTTIASSGPSYWDELERDFARAEVEVVGGPALLRPEARGPERIFHALLTHPLVVGPIRARYAAIGAFRATSQTELILCNLSARRPVFEKIGQLPVELYPNEENEWLDRAQAAASASIMIPRCRSSARSARRGARWPACSCATASAGPSSCRSAAAVSPCTSWRRWCCWLPWLPRLRPAGAGDLRPRLAGGGAARGGLDRFTPHRRSAGPRRARRAVRSPPLRLRPGHRLVPVLARLGDGNRGRRRDRRPPA